MRRLVTALLLCAAAVGAQAPAPAVAPPVAPKAPGKGGGEFRVGGVFISGDRSYEFRNSVSNATGSMQGVDVVLRARAIGLQFKALTSTFETQPHVTSADGRLLLFPPVFSLMGGIGRRALWSDLNADNPNLFEIAIVGVSSTVAIGGSGLRTHFSAAVYQPFGESKTKDKIEKGMEGEAAMLYKLPKMPFYVQAGYRTEVFTSKAGTTTMPEEVRGIKVGGGIVFGGN